MADGRRAIETLLQDLVRIDSVNPSLVSGAAGEAAIAAYITDCLRAAGFTWGRIETFGHGVHGSAYNVGIDAIALMGRVIARLEAFDRAELPRQPFHARYRCVARQSVAIISP